MRARCLPSWKLLTTRARPEGGDENGSSYNFTSHSQCEHEIFMLGLLEEKTEIATLRLERDVRSTPAHLNQRGLGNATPNDLQSFFYF